MSALEFLNEQKREGDARDVRNAMKSEDGAVSDTVGALSTQANYAKAEAVLQVLNAFNASKLTITGTCIWTIDDLRAWSFAVRALGTSWEITEQAKAELDRRGKRER